MPDQSKYSSCKATEVRQNDKGNFGCRHLYDGQVINNAQEGNFFTKSLVNPWAEVELTEAVYIVAIEVTTYGVADDERFIFTNFHAGMTSTAKTDGSKPANVITDVPLMIHYRGPAAQGEILHITFPTPVMAKYVLLQGKNLNHPWNIAELKVIEGKLAWYYSCTYVVFCYFSYHAATFDECPKRDRVVVTSNQVQYLTCTVLCTVLYCTVLHCTVLYCTVVTRFSTRTTPARTGRTAPCGARPRPAATAGTGTRPT